MLTYAFVIPVVPKLCCLTVFDTNCFKNKILKNVFNRTLCPGKSHVSKPQQPVEGLSPFILLQFRKLTFPIASDRDID